MSDKPEAPVRSVRDRLLDALEQRLNLSELFSFLSHFGLVMVPLDTRRPLRELLSDLDALPVPEYVRGPQALGVLMAVLFAIEAFTGMLLAFHYRPTPDAAHTSTLTIVEPETITERPACVIVSTIADSASRPWCSSSRKRKIISSE